MTSLIINIIKCDIHHCVTFTWEHGCCCYSRGARVTVVELYVELWCHRASRALHTCSCYVWMLSALACRCKNINHDLYCYTLAFGYWYLLLKLTFNLCKPWFWLTLTARWFLLLAGLDFPLSLMGWNMYYTSWCMSKKWLLHSVLVLVFCLFLMFRFVQVLLAGCSMQTYYVLAKNKV